MEQPQLVMLRATLEDIPEPELPEDYSFRCFAEGDEVALEEVFRQCFDRGWNRDRIVKTFIEHHLWSPQRMMVLCHGDSATGTATAWEGAKYPGHAMLHYVAVLPEHAGKGLGFALVARTLQLMRSFGYRDAWLSTDDWRLPAIVVYLQLGFQPVFDHESHRDRWEIIRHKLTAAGKDVDELFSGRDKGTAEGAKNAENNPETG